MSGDVTAAVQRDLAAIGVRDEALAESGLAAAALELAAQLDGDNSATSKAACAKALGEILATLRELAPVAQLDDQVDELAARAAKKLKRGAA